MNSATDNAQVLALWDIDHTLIENDGVSKATYALAAELLIGHLTATPPVTEGRTDAAIMAELLSGNGCDPDRFPLRRIWEALTEAGRRNEAQLRARGQALPGAAECLRRLATGSPALASLLREHLAEYGTGPDGRLFTGPRGGTVKESVYTDVWQEARRRALTPAEVASPLATRPYDLRHSCVSTWLAAGVDPAQIADWVGHSTAVLHRVYAHVLPGQDEVARQRIETFFSEEEDLG